MSNGKWKIIPLPLAIAARFLPLPLHRAFLRSVDFRLGDLGNFTEQESLDVIEQEVLSIGGGQIQTIVVDYLRLFLQPATPTRLAYLGRDSFTKFIKQRGKSQRRTFLATVFTFNSVRHRSSPLPDYSDRNRSTPTRSCISL